MVTEPMTGTCTGMCRLQLHRRAEPSELRGIRRCVARWAQQNALSDEALIDLQLALGEAVSNGVEHAYGMGDRDATVDVELEIRPPQGGASSVVAVRVEDRGRWRPVPLLSGYRGRGLALIRQLSDDMRILRTRSGTQVCFEIPVHR